MGVRDLNSGNLKLIASAKLSVSTATPAAFDFGTPNDINLAATTGKPGFGYRPGDRLLLIVDTTTTGTANKVTVAVQDANDSSGSIGTPATALTDGTLAQAAVGDGYLLTMITVQPGRPWIRVNAVSDGTTDTFVCQALLFAVPRTGI